MAAEGGAGASGANPWRLAVDTGGTFTDCVATGPDGREYRLKVLSSSSLRAVVEAVEAPTRVRLSGLPAVPDGFFRGFSLRRLADGSQVRVPEDRASEGTVVLECLPEGMSPGEVVSLDSPEEAPVLAARILTGTRPGDRLQPLEMRLGTTKGTNALLEEKGGRVAFFVTEGFADLLRIGNQQRPDLFALAPVKPEPLHTVAVEVRERLSHDGTVLRPLDEDHLRGQADALRADGFDTAAVGLLHSWVNPAHEDRVAEILRQMGFRHISRSARLAPRIKILGRAETAVVDAYLAETMRGYLAGVAGPLATAALHVMTSAGGLHRCEFYEAKDSLLSGPAGGAVGMAALARQAGETSAIGFDMGGTSTDVVRCHGRPRIVPEHRVGRARVVAPAVQIESVAAGGGSICWWDGRRFRVGPHSAGAKPGPACYGAGGPLTLTDVHLLLGRLDPATFAIPVDPRASARKFEELKAEAGAQAEAVPSRELLEGLLAIADETMAAAVRTISVREGYDPSDDVLVAFGGAGGLHACAVADRLGMRRILHAQDSGLLSARGLEMAAIERTAETSVLSPLAGHEAELKRVREKLREQARGALASEGLAGQAVAELAAEVEMRFCGQESSLACNASGEPAEWETRFLERYRGVFGYLPARETEVVALRVTWGQPPPAPIAEEFIAKRRVLSCEAAKPQGLVHEFVASSHLGGRADLTGPPEPLSFHRREELESGAGFAGPAVVQDRHASVYVAPGWNATVGSRGTLRLDRECGRHETTPALRHHRGVEREIVTQQLRGIVRDMGALLQRTACSTNVKERLDFSCALLDPDGQLVVNAPHIPVHLGALGACVRQVAAALALRPGDTAVTNHPGFGGSHLPDVSLVTPVHTPEGRLVGYVANRAHHAEIGGLAPGSMPPDARRLTEEGVVLPPDWLVKDGVLRWDAVRARLEAGPFPSRAVEDNLADLHAQLAANRQGAEAFGGLAARLGTEHLLAIMRELRSEAADAVRRLASRLPASGVRADEALDDGSPLRVAVQPAPAGGLVVDFTRSGPQHPGNLNATPGIVRSALVYVLRLLLPGDLPLNEGLLSQVEIVLPAGSLLHPFFSEDPAACPAVAAGNVETSQRLVDTLLKAFGRSACSQGTMNNLLFGNDRGSYYETIGGGAGAVAGMAGASGLHTHMTNTAITDPEILERRHPVRLVRFALRPGSGGSGEWPGGDGLVRELFFTEPVTVSLISQHRTAGPYGQAGGQPGQPGRQMAFRANGTAHPLAGVDRIELDSGDRLLIETPGGGGWGTALAAKPT